MVDFLDAIVENIFQDNSSEFDRLKNGESKLIGFMGQIMKQAKGKGRPSNYSKEVIHKIYNGMILNGRFLVIFCKKINKSTQTNN